ncbi:metal-sensitive transcriptional regulator [Neomoorella thermoacetica]|uniref:Copper-sensing transcriptional repressor CsoR n=3 Tax=Neomoorella thermoacetica TaxID=1525 RepID=A0A1D7XBV3_NEOTH|nr:metal-sensitive transcriptional regulator [Moorella thermoacetica]AKX94474.1 copper-sensing transcriptional repressor CsoR [Moorella thermoacetica]AKX97110.1 copper-sensing transcriptional repressor CsoR [Moorella thermoacetica]AOQ24406.1 Copper-sensing transcriptional repressor CsoR [Moorella thermoacetica]APC08870.1 copper-sensing transcriptional repressor CsoR [Moorella thermoacetica]OIQ08402.1 copper-sensing transcriptional repressor CsoR [Moorella thermoacetica]
MSRRPGEESSYAPQREDLLLRLRKIEGQVKGIHRMIEEDKYCVDILIQIAAVRAALKKVGSMIFEAHVRGCVRTAIVNQADKEIISELIDVLNRFIS